MELISDNEKPCRKTKDKQHIHEVGVEAIINIQKSIGGQVYVRDRKTTSVISVKMVLTHMRFQNMEPPYKCTLNNNAYVTTHQIGK